jgi:hypothetical protein
MWQATKSLSSWQSRMKQIPQFCCPTRKGRVGGFSGSPMPTVRVTSGVSVKIPVVIPRVARVNLEDPDKAMDIAAELVANTALTWTSLTDESSASAEEARSKVRQGRVRIPSKCLREIISEHSSFSSRICVPPVSVKGKHWPSRR